MPPLIWDGGAKGNGKGRTDVRYITEVEIYPTWVLVGCK